MNKQLFRMASQAASPFAGLLPNPVFEGSEKRLEVDFLPSSSSSHANAGGLRCLSRDQLDELMTLARCTIVSSRSNSSLDAYVLSESSLFVYPTKWVLKTCGTTRLLHSLPRLLELAAQLGLSACSCKFTRASFLFPEQQVGSSAGQHQRGRRACAHDRGDMHMHGSTQLAACMHACVRALLIGGLSHLPSLNAWDSWMLAPRQRQLCLPACLPACLPQLFPHTGFEDEVAYLDQYFGHLCPGGSEAFMLGQQYNGLQWHVYLAASSAKGSPPNPRTPARPTFNMEICMTELSKDAARQFFRTSSSDSAPRTTERSGIVHLKPGAMIDDYLFEPCGYSMNGIDHAGSGSGLITIHITPEEGFSYASVEISGYQEDVVDPSALLAAAVRIFQPGKVAMALTVSDVRHAGSARSSSFWSELGLVPKGYGCSGAACQVTGSGAKVSFYNLDTQCCGEVLEPPGSPTTVLDLHEASSTASFLSSASSDSELEVDAS